MSNDKVQFPAKKYTDVKKEWIGKDYIVTPSIFKILVENDMIKDKNVIDVGCGNGYYSNCMLGWGAKSVHGIDQSIDMINEAKTTYNKENLTFECLSTFDMSYEEKYDVAVAFFVLEFNSTIDDLFLSIKKIQKCLKKGGVFVAIIPNGTLDYNPTPEEGKKFGASWEVDPSTKRYDGEKFKVNFYDKNGEIVGNAPVTFFFKETYEKAGIEGGFKKIDYQNIIASDEGIKTFGEEFFDSFINQPKVIFFIGKN